MAFPIIAGIVAGAASNLISSGIQSHTANKAAEADREARKKAAEKLRQQGQITDIEYNKVINDINEYYNQRGSLGSKEDVNKFKSDITGYNPEDYVYEFDDFNYDKTKEDFLNPYYGRIIGDTANSIQHTAAGAGLGRGTGAALNIAKGTAEKSDELYKTAMQEYNTDREFEYQKYADAIKNNQSRLDALRQGQQYKIGLEGDLAQDYYNTQDAAMSDKLKAQQDRLAAQQNYANAITSLY